MLKSLSSVSKKKFLKSGGVKRNYENIMKSNDGISSHHRSENEGISLGDFLNKNLPRKREYHTCLIKKASTLRCSEKQVLLQRIKAAINRCSVK